MWVAHERGVEAAHALAGLMRADAARVARRLLLALRVHLVRVRLRLRLRVRVRLRLRSSSNLDLLRATPQLGGAALGRHEVARLELMHNLVRVRLGF